MDRWDSGEDHGGVTVEELKTLLDDWRAPARSPPRCPRRDLTVHRPTSDGRGLDRRD